MLIARDLDGKPEIRLTLKIDFTEEKQNLKSKLDLCPVYNSVILTFPAVQTAKFSRGQWALSRPSIRP